MAGTYSHLYVQIVFAVKHRQNLLSKQWREHVFGFITQKHKAVIVNGVADHVHVFVGLNPSKVISDLVRDIKKNSSNYINKNKWVKGRFCWQEGYGAFSYAHSQIENVYNYILNQEKHHQRKSFKQEYINFLNKFQIAYNEKYLFDWID
jgi:REP element-mobilizing transposase RayT